MDGGSGKHLRARGTRAWNLTRAKRDWAGKIAYGEIDGKKGVKTLFRCHLV